MTASPTPSAEAVEIAGGVIADHASLPHGSGKAIAESVFDALLAAGWTLTPPDNGEGFLEATMHREALLDAEEAKDP